MIRGCSGNFSGSKSKQEKAAAPKGVAAAHIGRQCRPKKRRGYAAFQRFSHSLKLGVAGAPVSDFGVGKGVTRNTKARIVGISGKKFRCCILV